MIKIKNIIIVVLSMVMLFGSVLTVNAATLRNNWCCPGAADRVIWEGLHTCKGSEEVHTYRAWECMACGNILDYTCKYSSK